MEKDQNNNYKSIHPSTLFCLHINHFESAPPPPHPLSPKISRWNLLFDEEHYQRKTRAQKILNLLIMCCPFVHWSSVFLAILFNLDNFSLPLMGEDIAFSIGGMMVSMRLVQFNRCRAEVSSILRELNQWNQEMRSEPAGRELGNLVHYWQLVVFGTVTSIGSFIAIPQTVFAVVTGRPYYNNIFPMDTTRRSPGFWVVCTFQLFTLVSSTFSSCLQECILNDMFTEVSVYCYNLNRRIQRLREVDSEEKVDEDEEYARLLKIVRDVQGMERLLKRSNSFTNNFLIVIFTMFYMAIAICAFVLIYAAERGAIYVVKSLLYPIFVFQVVLMWCLLGQVLMDQVICVDDLFPNLTCGSSFPSSVAKFREFVDGQQLDGCAFKVPETDANVPDSVLSADGGAGQAALQHKPECV